MNFKDKEILTTLRNLRGFDAERYIEQKITTVHNWLTTNNINCIIVGVSGGIDSALVLAFFKQVKEISLSKGKKFKIVPYVAPIYNCKGVSGQIEATDDAIKFITELDLEEDMVVMNLENVFKNYQLEGNSDWADGQMASIIRTPLAYYLAAIEQTKGYNSIVAGTTNKSEGSYIGYFGKASDGMNDIQIIADIYKSEVFKVSKLFNIPEYIMKRIPKGDIFDGSSDEELMGVTYDELELFLLAKEFDINLKEIIEDNNFVEKIEALHTKNLHKYQVGMPAHFLNVLRQGIKGGWE